VRNLAEIEKAVDHLSPSEKRELHRYLQEALQTAGTAPAAQRPHSVLDIGVVRLGSILCVNGSDDDILGEMLEGSP
jgi:hypothetical protein